MVTLQTVDKYEIVDAIGTGGMGTVFRAYDQVLERVVALKLLHLEPNSIVSEEELLARFSNEARAVARLNHPAVVSIFDYGDRDPAGPYIVMEYVNGCALDEYMRQRQELNLEDGVSAIVQVLGGLEYAHRQRVVHRDIKPPNLLITRDGVVKITDFGIAKIGPGPQTHTGLLVGTPQYMAPEQYIGGVVDHRCDVHAAAAVLYELLTGSPPFNGTPAEIMYKVCSAAPPAMSTVAPAIPVVLDAVVAKALEKSPADRFQSAGAFQEALRSAWQSHAATPVPTVLSEAARMVARTARHHPMPEATPSGRRKIFPPGPEASPIGGGSSSAGSGAHAGSAHAESAFRTGSTDAQQSLAAWSQELLAEAEQQLRPIVGVMARVMVRKAAASTANRQQLYELIASHLRTPEERRRFLGGDTTPAPPAKDHMRPPAPTVADPALSGQPGRPVTSEETERAAKLLANYLGPLAFVLARKAAQTATNDVQLYQLLAANVPDARERESFLRDAGHRT
jgi:eukaryotic-like serine/threonine-protein kinase